MCSLPGRQVVPQVPCSLGLDEHAELATAASGDTQVVVQEQRLKGGGAALPGGPEVAGQLGQGELWQAAQQASNSTCTRSSSALVRLAFAALYKAVCILADSWASPQVRVPERHRDAVGHADASEGQPVRHK